MAPSTSNSKSSSFRSPTTLSIVAAAATAQQQQQQIQMLLQAVSQRRNIQTRAPKGTSRLCCYVRGCLWLTAIGSLTVLLILTPLLVEPAIAALVQNFASEPVVCATANIETKFAGSSLNKDGCHWTSCRQGCTGDLHRCLHVFVHVLLEPWSSYNASLANRHKRATGWAMSWSTNELNETDNSFISSTQLPLITDRIPDSLPWNGTNIPLLVNVKGCGYPPGVICSDFLDLIGEPGTLFPCYVSNIESTMDMAVVQYDAASAYDVIVLCFVAPLILFIVTVTALCFTHCKTLRQSCLRRCPKTRERSRVYKYNPAPTNSQTAAQQNWQRIGWRTMHGNRQRVASRGYQDPKQQDLDESMLQQVQLT